MKNIIKDFERILYNSLVHYPNKNKNIASTFKVTLPEIYYEKFRELNESQKKIISKFISIFLDILQFSEQVNNQEIKEGLLNFTYENDVLLTKQNIMNYMLNFFDKCINPHHDIKMLKNATYDVEIEGNQIGKAKYLTFLGKYLPLNNCGCHVVVKLNSKFQDKIYEFMEMHKLGVMYLRTSKDIDIFLTFTFFEGNAVYFKNSLDKEIEEFNTL